MTFAQLQTELYARGFDYLNQDTAGQTRAKRWINEAMVEDICDPWPWPFLETTVTGAAPLTVSDIKDILYVVNSTSGAQMDSSDLRDIIDRDANALPTSTGTPDSYYIDGSVLKLYPVGTATLSVRYIAVPAELSASTDVPLLPARFHPLVVDGAAIRAYRDSDNFEAVVQLQQQFDDRLGRMVDAMFSRNLDNSQYVQSTWAYG